MLVRVFLFILFALSQVPGWAQEQSNWQLELEEGDVRVYLKAEEGADMSVRVTTTTASTAAQVKSVIDAVESYPEWVHRCAEAYRVPGGTPDEYVYYSRINLPFPFSDREVVARITQTWDASTRTLSRSISAEPDAVVRNDNYNRMEAYEAEWKITDLPDGRVSITCICRTAAGAGLPAWLRKDILAGGPAQTMQNLVDRLAARR